MGPSTPSLGEATPRLRVYPLREEPGDLPTLLVAHGGVCRIIHSYFHDLTNEAFFQYNLGNGSLARYELL